MEGKKSSFTYFEIPVQSSLDDSHESLNLISKSLTRDEVRLELVRCQFEKTLAIHFPGFVQFILLQFHHDKVGSINDS